MKRRHCKLICWAAVRAGGRKGALCPACDATQRALDLLQAAALDAACRVAAAPHVAEARAGNAVPLVLEALTGNDAALLAISKLESFK